MKIKKNLFAFTLIELLVVIAIIGVLATLAVSFFNSARTNARDSKRLADMKQVQTALELYYSENGAYPSVVETDNPLVSPSSGIVLISSVPSAPSVADGSCQEGDYVYMTNSDLSDYSIEFCTGSSASNLPSGVKYMTPAGIVYNNAIGHNLTYSAGSGGTITGSSSQMIAHGESGTEVVAVADSGFYFVEWSDGLISEARTDSNVTESITVEAIFAANQYSLNYYAGPGGSINGSSSQLVNHGDNSTSITALANANYVFDRWSDGLTSTTRVEQNVDEDQDFFALFESTLYPSCGTVFDSRDNNIYETVVINSQCWTRSNAKYLPAVHGPNELSTSDPRYYVYGYSGNNIEAAKSSANYSTRGALYNRVSALTACPSGWSLPSDAQWFALEDYLTDSGYFCDPARNSWSCSGATPKLVSGGNSGFDIILSGILYNTGSFGAIDSHTLFWSSSLLDIDPSYAFYRTFNPPSSDTVGRFRVPFNYGFSVRCIKN